MKLEITKQSPIGKLEIVINMTSPDRYINCSVNGNSFRSRIEWNHKANAYAVKVSKSETKKVLGKSLGMDAFLTLDEVSTKAFLAKLETKKAAKIKAADALKEAYLTGKKAVKPKWHDGEHLSGYAIYNTMLGKLLVDAGIAKDVDYWGYLIDSRIIKKYGEEFTIPQAKIKKEEKVKKEVDNTAAFEKAKKTDKPIKLYSYISDGCLNHSEDCSFDNVTVYAMPNGEIKTVAHCCH